MERMKKEDIIKYTKDKDVSFAAQIITLRTKEIPSSSYENDPILTLAMRHLCDKIFELVEKNSAEKRKVLFTDGMSNDAVIMITDAPKEHIENLCRIVN